MKKKTKVAKKIVRKAVKAVKKKAGAVAKRVLKKAKPIVRKAKKSRAVRKAAAVMAPRVEESKYYPRPTPYLPPRQWEHEELPLKYGDTRIVVMVRDPHWIFAYWEVSDERRMQVEREASASWNDLRKVLRV